MGVNLSTSKIRQTGKKIETPQYEMYLRFEWKAGTDKSHAETVLFPDCLAGMTEDWIQEHLADLIAALRVKAQVNTESAGARQ